MRCLAAVLMIGLAFALAGCESETETSDAIKQCTTGATGSPRPRDFDQCVRTCKICENGNTVTCSTSCRLKGAI